MHCSLLLIVQMTGPRAPATHHLTGAVSQPTPFSIQLSVNVFYHITRRGCYLPGARQHPAVPGSYATCHHLLCRQTVLVIGTEVMCHSKLVTNNMAAYIKSRIRKDKLAGKYLPSHMGILHLLLSSDWERYFSFSEFLH